MLQLAVGPVGHGDVMRAIELLGTEVAPVVRAEVARRQSAQAVPMSRHGAADVRTIGILGAGKSGVAIARRALAAGYKVAIATSGSAERTTLVTRILLPGAVPVTAEQLPLISDVIFVCVPLRHWRTLPTHAWESRIVVDVMNYWPPVDGFLPEFETSDRSTSARAPE